MSNTTLDLHMSASATSQQSAMIFTKYPPCSAQCSPAIFHHHATVLDSTPFPRLLRNRDSRKNHLAGKPALHSKFKCKLSHRRRRLLVFRPSRKSRRHRLSISVPASSDNSHSDPNLRSRSKTIKHQIPLQHVLNNLLGYKGTRILLPFSHHNPQVTSNTMHDRCWSRFDRLYIRGPAEEQSSPLRVSQCQHPRFSLSPASQFIRTQLHPVWTIVTPMAILGS
ncbi:hypothetical protein IWZ00DRAFT_93260 [Phyllosticta capitalensis]